MVILTMKIGKFEFTALFWFLTDKQKTKKVREFQITQIFIVSITICYIFCALVN